MNQIEKNNLDERINEYKGPCILTGMLEHSDKNDVEMFRDLFGNSDEFEDEYNLYFHWYNMIHELGHLIYMKNKSAFEWISPVYEEKHVNDLAVAYWRTYGEKARLDRVYEIVTRIISQLKPPCSDEDILTHYEDEKAFREASRDSNDYAFIQFSLVKHAIETIDTDFYETLKIKGFDVRNNTACKLAYSDLDIQMIVDDAVEVVRSHGLHMPDVKVFEYYHPHVHCARGGE